MQPVPCLDRRFPSIGYEWTTRKSAHLIFTVTVRPREFAFSHQAQTSLAIAITPASI